MGLTTPDHARAKQGPSLPERLDLAGYGGLALMLAGGMCGGPGGTALAGLGTLTTLGSALYFCFLFATRRAAARRDR